MKVLKNNIREILIWIVYLIGVIFIPLEGTSIYIYVIGLIAIRTLSNTHKLFAKVNSYSEKLKKENYIIEQTTNMYRGNASLLCYSINKLLDEFQVDLKITPEMIYQFDDEKIENRRKESLDTIINDTNIINKYLKEFKYKIVVFENYQTYYFALLNEEQISKLNELKNG